jgi:hypothetical protein
LNKCNDITLGSGSRNILEGQGESDFRGVLPPSALLSTVVKSKHSFGRIKCCIVYELTDSTSPTTPLWWGYRVFLAVEVFIRPFSDKNKATAILFKIKDSTFNGGNEDIDKLRENVLRHSAHRPPKAAVWNLGGRSLFLNPTFDFNVPASVRVVLEKPQTNIEKDPIFHRTSTFA